jgi:hypothetical protein
VISCFSTKGNPVESGEIQRRERKGEEEEKGEALPKCSFFRNASG